MSITKVVSSIGYQYQLSSKLPAVIKPSLTQRTVITQWRAGMEEEAATGGRELQAELGTRESEQQAEFGTGEQNDEDQTEVKSSTN